MDTLIRKGIIEQTLKDGSIKYKPFADYGYGVRFFL